MTTLTEEAELIIRRLSGGDIPDDSPYDMDYVIREYRDAMREDLKLELLGRRQGPDDDKSPVSQFIATYTVQFAEETVSRRVYVNIPEDFMSLKHNKGIHDLVPIHPEFSHLQISMVRTDNPNVSAHLPIGDAKGIQFYYIEGMKIFTVRNVMKDKIKSAFLKLIIPAPNSIGNNDPLPVLAENVVRIRDIVIQRITNRFPQDRISDNNPNIRAVNEQPR
jgi:hypothetical protein